MGWMGAVLYRAIMEGLSGKVTLGRDLQKVRGQARQMLREECSRQTDRKMQRRVSVLCAGGEVVNNSDTSMANALGSSFYRKGRHYIRSQRICSGKSSPDAAGEGT